jgi:sugar phosphate isomerase/epimerase
MYEFLIRHHFSGLEIAPTRIFPYSPYEKLDEAADYARMLKSTFGLTISSIQSIWYGKSENIFSSNENRCHLIEYTKKIIKFSKNMNCHNIVFGCPRNRTIPDKSLKPIAIDFFKVLGDYAAMHDTIIAIEPNPPIYHTNFINTTQEAFEFCHEVNSDGIMVNIDLGTSIYYRDSLDFINNNIKLVNHIHISEPFLAPIIKRELHKELKHLNYNKWFSIEMKDTKNINDVKSIIKYIEELFLDL